MASTMSLLDVAAELRQKAQVLHERCEDLRHAEDNGVWPTLSLAGEEVLDDAREALRHAWRTIDRLATVASIELDRVKKAKEKQP